eukprot:914465-Prymnesium_polylepis.1
MPAPFLACTGTAAGSYGPAEFAAALSMSHAQDQPSSAGVPLGCGPEVLTAPSTPVNSEAVCPV